MPRRHKTLPKRRRRTPPLPEFTIIDETFEPDLKPVPKTAQQVAVGETQRAPLQRNGGRRVTDTTVALVSSLAGVSYSTLVASVKRAYQSMAGAQGTAAQLPEEEAGIELVWMPNIKSPKKRVGIGNIRKHREIHKGLSTSFAGKKSFSSPVWGKRIREFSLNACEDEEGSEDMKAIMRAKRQRSNSFPQAAIECESLSSYTKVLDRIGEPWIHALHEEVIADVEDGAHVHESVLESDAEADTKVNLTGGGLNITNLRMDIMEPTPLARADLETTEHDSVVDDSSETSILSASYMSSSTFEFPSRNATVHSPFATSRGVGSHIFEILERLRKSGADEEAGKEAIHSRPRSRKSESGITADDHAEEENLEAENTSGWDLFEMSGDGHAWNTFDRSADWDPGAESEDGYMNSTFTDDEDFDGESGLSSLGTSYQIC